MNRSTWSNGRKVQAVAWLTACSMLSFVSLTVYGVMHPPQDLGLLMGSLGFLSTQTAAGISYLMGSSMPEQRSAPHAPPASATPPMPPEPDPQVRG